MKNEKTMNDSSLRKYLLNVWNILYNILQDAIIFVRVAFDRRYALFHKPPVVIDVKSSISYIVAFLSKYLSQRNFSLLTLIIYSFCFLVKGLFLAKKTTSA